MTDVRSLLKNERASRRIQHKYASYTTTGTLLCTACHLQLKSESLWDGHLRSAGHIMQLQKAQEQPQNEGNKKKRKADDEGDETLRKKSKSANGLPEGFFDASVEPEAIRETDIETPTPKATNGIQIPSRPATPAKVTPPKPQPEVNEDEWAAFEADIAAAEVPEPEAATISAPAMSAAEVAAKSLEETNAQRKERHEAELEGDREDAARKLEDEFEEMEGLEQRARKLRERREALRAKQSMVDLHAQPLKSADPVDDDEEDDDDDDDGEEEADWDGFRMRG